VCEGTGKGRGERGGEQYDECGCVGRCCSVSVRCSCPQRQVRWCSLRLKEVVIGRMLRCESGDEMGTAQDCCHFSPTLSHSLPSSPILSRSLPFSQILSRASIARTWRLNCAFIAPLFTPQIPALQRVSTSDRLEATVLHCAALFCPCNLRQQGQGEAAAGQLQYETVVS